jgi:hypothetical protein
MLDSRDITLAAVFTSLYVVINLVQASTVGNPAISGPVQLRVADCLIPLTALFGWPILIGVTMGAFLTNAYAYIAPVDLVVGPLANLIAAYLVFLLRRRMLSACIVAALPIGVLVGGGYLWWYFDPPEITGLRLPAWATMTLSLTLSSLIVMIFGYFLLRILSSKSLLEPLKSRGLKTLK